MFTSEFSAFEKITDNSGFHFVPDISELGESLDITHSVLDAGTTSTAAKHSRLSLSEASPAIGKMFELLKTYRLFEA